MQCNLILEHFKNINRIIFFLEKNFSCHLTKAEQTGDLQPTIIRRPMHFAKLVVALLFGTVLASSSYRARPISQVDIGQVTEIIEQGEDQPEQLVELFKDRRLRYSKDSKHLLSKMISWSLPGLFKCFFKLIDFEAETRDGVMSRLLDVAIFMGNVEVCIFLMKRDFKYTRKYDRNPWRFMDMNKRIAYRPALRLRHWDLDEFNSLISKYPKYAAGICPQPQDSIDPERLTFWVEAAHHCAIVSENPVVFDPTAWINVVFQNRHGDVGFDGLMSRLCELGAEVDQSIIDTVKEKPLVFHQTFRYLRDRGMVDPASSPFPADDNGVYDLRLDDCMTLSRILRHGEIPESITGLLDGCRFAFSHEMSNLLGCMISFGRAASFVSFFDRTDFGHAQRDEVMTDLLRSSFGHGCAEIYHFLLGQDFRILNGYTVFFYLEGWNLERATALLVAHPQRAGEMSPYPESLQFSRNAEHAGLLIDLAAQCNLAEFRPSVFLNCLVRNRHLDDAGMEGAIRRLCYLGARVEPSTYESFEIFNHQAYPQSRRALQEHEAWQDEVKEPGCD